MRDMRQGGNKRNRATMAVLFIVACVLFYRTSVASWATMAGESDAEYQLSSEGAVRLQAELEGTVAEGSASRDLGPRPDGIEALEDAVEDDGDLEAEPIEEHEGIDPTKDMEKALFEEKLALVDTVLAQRIFEANVSRIPILLPLFRELEKAQSTYFVKSLKMSTYDKSCDRYYMDSLSSSGNFDRALYAEMEFTHKVTNKNKNKTGELSQQSVCDDRAEYGCCAACTVPDCCLCKFDGKKSIVKGVLKPKHGRLRLQHRLLRGMTHWNTPEGKRFSELYGEVATELGFRGTDYEMRRLTFLKNFNYIPPEGFLAWHTNRYDNNGVPYRLYMLSTDRDGGSFFKYLLPDGSLAEVADYHGAVRLFKNTNVDRETGAESFLWHTVVSPKAHRHSLGFEITPALLVALLDACDGCWEDFQMLLDEIDPSVEEGSDPLEDEEMEEELKSIKAGELGLDEDDLDDP